MNHPAPCLPIAGLVTLFTSTVQAGFPSPAADYEQSRIDLNQHLLLNETASFLFRLRGNSMTGIGIYEGDTLIVDRSITPQHNHIVLAIIDGEFTVKRLYLRANEARLIAENPAYPPITLKEGQELKVWGVVTFNLHRLLSA